MAGRQGVCFGFEIVQALGQIVMREREFAQAYEGAHDVDGHFHGPWRAEHCGGHDGAMLREGQRQFAPTAPT